MKIGVGTNVIGGIFLPPRFNLDIARSLTAKTGRVCIPLREVHTGGSHLTKVLAMTRCCLDTHAPLALVVVNAQADLKGTFSLSEFISSIEDQIHVSLFFNCPVVFTGFLGAIRHEDVPRAKELSIVLRQVIEKAARGGARVAYVPARPKLNQTKNDIVKALKGLI